MGKSWGCDVSRKKIQWLISYVKMFLLGYLIQMGLFKIDCPFRNLESMVRGPCTFMCPPLLGHIHGMMVCIRMHIMPQQISAAGSLFMLDTEVKEPWIKYRTSASMNCWWSFGQPVGPHRPLKTSNTVVVQWSR